MKINLFYLSRVLFILPFIFLNESLLVANPITPAHDEIAGAIEKRLGFSDEAFSISVHNVFSLTNAAPDMMPFWFKLKAIGETKNFTAASFIAPFDEMSIRLCISNNVPGRLRAVLEENLIDGQTSLLALDGVSNIVVTRVYKGKSEGRFDWHVSNITKGQCNFIYSDGEIEYLGIARDNPIDVYDCFHVFKDELDAFDLKHWMVRESYALIRVTDEAFIKSVTEDRFYRKLFAKSHLHFTVAFSIDVEELYAVVSDSQEELNKALALLSEKFNASLVEREVTLKENEYSSNMSEIKSKLKAKYSKD